MDLILILAAIVCTFVATFLFTRSYFLRKIDGLTLINELKGDTDYLRGYDNGWGDGYDYATRYVRMTPLKSVS